MNTNFLSKAALIVLLVATSLVAFWRYEVTVVEPHQSALLTSFRNNVISRDQLRNLLESVKDAQNGVSQILADAKVTEYNADQLQAALENINTADSRLLAGTQESVARLNNDIKEFLAITNQLGLFETKTQEFILGFAGYFQSFENDIKFWQKDSATAILQQVPVNKISVDNLLQKIDVLKNIIPELDEFKQKLQGISASVDQWVDAINAAPTVEEKQILFMTKQSLLKSYPDLFNTFDGYVLDTLDQEKVNVQQIATEILSSMSAIQKPLQEKLGALDNSIQTQIQQAQKQERQFRDLKRISVVGTFVVLLGLFAGLVIFTIRFQEGFNLFKYQTAKASEDSKELISLLKDQSGLVVANFELNQAYEEGLTKVSEGFNGRQIRLQNIDQLVRDTDSLVNESRNNFQTIKEEFYNTEKISQEIVQLTVALEGVALQMSVIAERAMLNVAGNHQQAVGKQDTIDELKYLSSRIRHAVSCTHDALDARKDTISDAKTKFTLIEKNMDHMTENARQALKEIAAARLDHSQEVSRVNEILASAKTKSMQIADEITALNRQVSDFSILTKHLDALHELAVKASALNAQSLLVDEKQEPNAATFVSSSKKMNEYIQEYFTKVFENGTLKANVKTSEIDSLVQTSPQKSASRINEIISKS